MTLQREPEPGQQMFLHMCTSCQTVFALDRDYDKRQVPCTTCTTANEFRRLVLSNSIITLK